MDAIEREESRQAEIQDLAREVARQEVASLCGLVLRRLHQSGPIDGAALAGIFGEALRDFGATADEPGEDS